MIAPLTHDEIKTHIEILNGQLFLIIQISPRFLYFAFLNIHHWLKIANISPHGPDDGSVEPKRYTVDFWINLSFHLNYLVINFSIYWRITNPLFTFTLKNIYLIEW